MTFTSRRTVIGAALALLLLTKPLPGQGPQVPAAVLTLKRMCCSKESGPAIKELSRISGVAQVVADHKARSLSIIATSSLISPKAIWESAERAKLEPTRLTIGQAVYTTKPKR
jgi:hypothetical protein